MANKAGDVDSSFSAHCPSCGHMEWEFGLSNDLGDDSRRCTNPQCQYVHWLRGPNKSETIRVKIPTEILAEKYAFSPIQAKRIRVRALVHSLLVGGQMSPETDIVSTAGFIDDEIEAIK